MKMEPIVSSETSAIRTQTPGNYPKRIIYKTHLASKRSKLERLADSENKLYNAANSTVCLHIQGDQKLSVHMMITIQKVTSNVQNVPRQSPDIY